jgi:DNA-binding transcriptional LysR family regulator
MIPDDGKALTGIVLDRRFWPSMSSLRRANETPKIGLRYLHEAAIAGSMRAAGDRIGVAASSISRQISQLEESLGFALIERGGGRSIRLTSAGALAVEHYQSQLAEQEAFFIRLSDLRGVRAGTINIALGEEFIGQPFTAMLEEFQRSSPMVRLTIGVGSSSEVIQQVLADESHMGLIFHMPSEPNIRVRSSVRQPLAILVAPNHPLASRHSVRLADLVDQSLCLLSKDFHVRQVLGAAEARQHIFLTPAMTMNSVPLMREAVRSGRYVAILPQISAASEIAERSLNSIPLIGEGLGDTTITLITRTGRRLEGAPMRMLTMLEARFHNWAADSLVPT